MSDTKKKFGELVSDFDTAMLVTETPKGELRARPMAIAKATDDGRIWFITGNDSGKVDELQQHDDCAVTMQDEREFLSVSGFCYPRKDQKLLNELWSPAFEAWFEHGKDDPRAVILEFQATMAEYWTMNVAQGLRYVFEAAKSLARGKSIDADKVGDHETMRF